MEIPYFGLISLFWVGFLGSLSVEVGTCYRAMANSEGDLPKRYRKPVYLVVRTFLAFSGGAIAVALDAKNPLTAFYLGASAPIVLDKLAQGALPTIPTIGEKS